MLLYLWDPLHLLKNLFPFRLFSVLHYCEGISRLSRLPKWSTRMHLNLFDYLPLIRRNFQLHHLSPSPFFLPRSLVRIEFEYEFLMGLSLLPLSRCNTKDQFVIYGMVPLIDVGYLHLVMVIIWTARFQWQQWTQSHNMSTSASHGRI